MTEVSYVPGTWTAVALDRCWMLVDAAPDSVAVREIWQRMDQAPDLVPLISGLLGLGLGHMPDFALLASDGTRYHLICRGEGRASLLGSGAPTSLDGIGLATWREHLVQPDVEQVVLGSPPAGTVLGLPAFAGVFLADSVTVTVAAKARAADPPAMPVHESPDLGPAEDTAEDTGYDFLFAATRAQTVEGAAMRPDADGGLLAPGGLIDDVPWRSSSGTQSAPAATEPDPATTIRRADMLALASRMAPADRIGPTVPALLCSRAHPNPPSNSSCRICGAQLPEQDPVIVPRPVLGVLRLSTGDVITLDRGVIMGRSPSTDYEGGERPHVVKLPSADGEISRTHLKVSLDGWHVLVTDLKSTNGTLIGLPGRAPERLWPQEPLPIQPGTVVTLADGIEFRFEVAE
jgi:FHA domain